MILIPESLFFCVFAVQEFSAYQYAEGLNGISDSVLGIRIIWRQMVLFLCNLSDQ